jgi:integrase
MHKGTGQWCKKHEGKPYYFGVNKDEALRRYVVEWPRIVDGKGRFTGGEATPLPSSARLTVQQLVNEFLTAKRERMESGELSGVMFSEYFGMGKEVAEVLGKGRTVTDLQPADFGHLRTVAARRLGPVALSKFVTMVRTMFNFAFSERLIASSIWYGDRFDKPEQKTLRKARNERPKKLLSAEDCWKLIDQAGPQLRAMIFLGLNCAYGSTDCAQLQRSAFTVRPGWSVFPRPKTETERRCPLWPETIEALEAAYAARPEPKGAADAGCVFLTLGGLRWVRYKDRGTERRGTNLDGIQTHFRHYAGKADVKLPGGFYVLRHTHRTHADAVKDRRAADAIMGHIDPTMGGHYVEEVADERLEAVTNHVRQWLLGGRKGAQNQDASRVTPDAKTV